VVDVTLTGAPLWSVVSGSWTCQATDSGTSCQDSAIPAAGQAQETLAIVNIEEKRARERAACCVGTSKRHDQPAPSKASA
jgi:hypothetical protein